MSQTFVTRQLAPRADIRSRASAPGVATCGSTSFAIARASAPWLMSSVCPLIAEQRSQWKMMCGGPSVEAGIDG
jgi:hypothetical protein